MRLGSSSVLAEGDALTRALELAHELAALPPLALQVAKQTIDLAAESSREAAALMEQLAYGMLAQTPDAQEARPSPSPKSAAARAGLGTVPALGSDPGFVQAGAAETSTPPPHRPM